MRECGDVQIGNLKMRQYFLLVFHCRIFKLSNFQINSMALTNERILNKLKEKFGEQLTGFSEPYGMLTFTIQQDLNIEVLRFLYDDEELRFQFLTDLCAVHYPDNKGEELAIVYHMHNLVDNVRIRFKAFINIEQPDILSATQVYEAANWLERETYDYYGVNFVGHPNLKRILNVEEMDYFPMRKEFPLEDQTRVDKDDEMFGRGGSLDFGNTRDETKGTIAESEKGHDHNYPV
jgi:NADH-quinone oxidoreductase subunit C